MTILVKHAHFNEIAGIKSFNVFDFLNLEQPIYGAASIKCFHMLLWKILSYEYLIIIVSLHFAWLYEVANRGWIGNWQSYFGPKPFGFYT